MTTSVPAVVVLFLVAYILAVVSVHALAGVLTVAGFPAVADFPAVDVVVDSGHKFLPVPMTPVKKMFLSYSFD